MTIANLGGGFQIDPPLFVYKPEKTWYTGDKKFMKIIASLMSLAYTGPQRIAEQKSQQLLSNYQYVKRLQAFLPVLR